MEQALELAVMFDDSAFFQRSDTFCHHLTSLPEWAMVLTQTAAERGTTVQDQSLNS